MMREFTRGVVYTFLLLCILCIPFPFALFTWQEAIANFCFSKIAHWISVHIIGITPVALEITSDSVMLYAELLFLFCLSVTVALTWALAKRNMKGVERSFIRTALCYYLALQLVKYGIDKIGHLQFYAPEPNILYTPLGDLDKDILFWSTMGTSYGYNIFMGIFEILAALLLFFRRARTIGLIVSAAILLNVVGINLGFDISVKVYSLLLLTIAAFLLSPQIKVLYNFFLKKELSALVDEQTPFEQRPTIRKSLKALVLVIFLCEASYPLTWHQQSPALHGAYEVLADDATPASKLAFKRFFVHKDGYFIWQDHNDQMHDLRLRVDTTTRQLILTDYDLSVTKANYRFNAGDSTLEIEFPLNGRITIIKTRAINWRSLPALRNQFHWTIEGAEN